MRGWQSDDGWWFAYAEKPLYRCFYGQGLDDDVLDRAGKPIEQLADALSMDYHKLAARILARHGWHGDRLRDERGRLTDRCGGCGARMENLGYWAKVERPVAEGEHLGTAGVSFRLTGEAYCTVKEIYLPTKREIREWVYQEYLVHNQSLERSDRS